MSETKQKIIRQTRERGGLVTALREKALDIVLGEQQVIKAYQVLARLQADSETPLAPPTAYRALDFWVEQGVLHKVAAVNGYVVCAHARHECGHHCAAPAQADGHSAFILVCTECGVVDEQSLRQEWGALRHAVADGGFMLTEEHVVLTGVCAECRQKQKSI
ncbi:Fur family transcriptional regulator [Neisseria leonii]|uniref:Fur family transcriptional regulator n=1 Tax=Neisseria leonii TaxID=2995413 RepID=A0A9X4E489_9NEIS|nr:Fur family transcriptional regulator [Neisseria sp. 51.81]MDD9328444.1 transcriptional repressor [Neisseria sp. 51.81]